MPPFSLSLSHSLSHPTTTLPKLRHLIRPFSTTLSLPADDLPYRRPVPESTIALATLLARETEPKTRAQTAARRAERQSEVLDNITKAGLAKDLQRQAWRSWLPGQVYSPHDLSPLEQRKAKAQGQVARRTIGLASRGKDCFDVLNINPLHEWKNLSMMSEFVSETGRIRHRRETGLRAVNQRRIAKAVRRAVGMGLMPSVHRHPEMLEEERREINLKRYGLDGSEGRVLSGR